MSRVGANAPHPLTPEKFAHLPPAGVPTLSASRQTKPLSCERGQRRQTIVQSLLADVFQDRLHAGQHLVTQELAGRFGVSHTPIREALIALAGIGIVDLLPNRGAVVRRVSAKEVREICQVRRLLECEATRSACGRIDPGELRSLAADLERLKSARATPASRFIDEARAVDSRLHDLIAHSCGNAFLANELGRLKILFRAFRDVIYTRHEERNDFRRLTEEAGEHLAIVQGPPGGRRPRGGAGHVPAHPLGQEILEPGPAGRGSRPHERESPAATGAQVRRIPPMNHPILTKKLPRLGTVCLAAGALLTLSAGVGQRRKRSSTTATSGPSWPRTASPATAPTAPAARPSCASTSATRPSRPRRIRPRQARRQRTGAARVLGRRSREVMPPPKSNKKLTAAPKGTAAALGRRRGRVPAALVVHRRRHGRHRPR